jgi:hypothetical protein
MTTPKPKVPMTAWLMLGLVALFALALSYLLDRRLHHRHVVTTVTLS